MADNPDRKRRLAAAAAIATAIAVPAEGLRQYAYYDPPGVLTVCYGHTGGVEKGRQYSLDECKTLLNADMRQSIETVDRCVPGLPENVLAAFGDAVYNLGPTIACNPSKSTAALRLSMGDIAGACEQLPRWNKARVAGVLVPLPGLTKRREAERAVCEGKI